MHCRHGTLLTAFLQHVHVIIVRGSLRLVFPPVQLWWCLLPQHIPMLSTHEPEFLTALSLRIMAFILLTHRSHWDSEVIDDSNMYCCALVFSCLNSVKKKKRKAHKCEFQSQMLQSLQPYLQHTWCLLWPSALATADSNNRSSTFPIRVYSHSTLH